MSILIPRSVRSIGGGAFSECSLDCFECPEDVLHVVGGMLVNKTTSVSYGIFGRVTKVTVPDAVTELCDRCFY